MKNTDLDLLSEAYDQVINEQELSEAYEDNKSMYGDVNAMAIYHFKKGETRDPSRFLHSLVIDKLGPHKEWVARIIEAVKRRRTGVREAAINILNKLTPSH